MYDQSNHTTWKRPQWITENEWGDLLYYKWKLESQGEKVTYNDLLKLEKQKRSHPLNGTLREIFALYDKDPNLDWQRLAFAAADEFKFRRWGIHWPRQRAAA